MKSSVISFFAIVLGFLLAIIFIKTQLLTNNTKFDQAGLGEGTAAYFPKINQLPMHVDSFYKYPALKKCISDNNKGGELVLWLGNSQLHGVNQYKKGDANAAEYLHNLILPKQKFLFAYSIPNANLQEHYLLYNYIISELPVKELIIPVFFDDTRESGLREDVLHEPIKQAILPMLDSSDLGKATLHEFAATKGADENQDMKALHATTQEKVEKYLDDHFNSVSTIWSSRANMRSALIYSYLFSFRNTVFGISPSSKRKKIPSRYSLNFAAFEKICLLSKKNGIKMLVYIPPIRYDVDQPYIAEEYVAFKKDIQTLQNKYGFTLYNAEMVVPPKYWGMKGSTTIGKGKLEIDFMHFQSEGHRLLADSLATKIQ